MMEESDAAVVRRVRGGETDAFRVLVERYSHTLFRLAYRMTGNEQDAEDVVQESFLRAFRHLGRFDLQRSFAAWLHRIAANCSINVLRRRPPLTLETGNAGEALASVPANTLAPDSMASNMDLHLRVQSALSRLTHRERAAFVLRHFEGKSIAEICAALKVGSSAAKHDVFRAVQKIRRALEPFLT